MEIRCGGSDEGSDLGGSVQASSSEDSTLGTSDGGGAVRRRHGKGSLIEEVEVAKNTNKDKTARHKKVRATALIPFRNTKCNSIVFLKS